MNDCSIQASSSGYWNAARVSLLHKDPFDRILVAQARHEGLTIVTPDAHIRKYDVPTLW